MFIGRTDAEAPILWPPDAKSWLIRNDPDTEKGWRQGEKEETEDEMVGWHHQLNGCDDSEQTVGQWRTGKPGVQQSMGSQRVGHDWATGQQSEQGQLVSVLLAQNKALSVAGGAVPSRKLSLRSLYPRECYTFSSASPKHSLRPPSRHFYPLCFKHTRHLRRICNTKEKDK